MYPSDLTDAQWAKLEPLLHEPAGDWHGGGRPRKYPLRQVTDAVLYVVKTGCQWRQMPVDFPSWQTVYQQLRAWRLRGTWERVTKSLREQGRKAGGRSSTPTVAIIDSQLAKTALKGGGGVTMRARRSKGASGTSRSTMQTPFIWNLVFYTAPARGRRLMWILGPRGAQLISLTQIFLA